MKFVDFITRIFFGKYNSAGFYKESKEKEKVSYTFTSIFPDAITEKEVLQTK